MRDIVRAYRLLAHSTGGVFNLGAGVPRSIQALLDGLIAVSELKVEVQQDPARMRGPEVPELYTSYEHAKSVVGWQPIIPFEQSLADIYQYWYERVGLELAA